MINPEISQLVLQQNAEHELWTMYDTPEKVDFFIMQEFGELKEEYQKAMIGASAFPLACELGDVFYLHEKRKNMEKPIPDYINAYVGQAYHIAELAGIDPNDALFIKILRNAQKYPSELEMLYDEYNDYVQASKQQWIEQGGDEAFSNAMVKIL